MEYLDFEVEVSGDSAGGYSVAVIHSPAGEARELMRFPFGAAEIERRMKQLQTAVLRSLRPPQPAPPTKNEADVGDESLESFGRGLFDALFTGEVRSLFDVSQRAADSVDKGLRIKLRIRPPELAVVPWEFLYDPRQGDYICLSRYRPVVRYIEVPQPIEPLSAPLPLRVLAMVASPSDRAQLDTGLERERIEKAVSNLKGLIELTWLQGSSWSDLQTAMRAGPWHVFHYTGHGGFDEARNEGLIALTEDDGLSYLLDATRLARLLADQKPLRLVVLNSCEGARGSAARAFSSTASVLVRRGIAAVLAMQYEITDRSSIELARVFYENLAQGLPVDAALTEARKAISMDSVEWGTPVLYMRSPDGLLFTPGTKARGTSGSGTPDEKSNLEAERGNQAPGGPKPPSGPTIPAERRALYKALSDRFNDKELREVCFELNIDYEELAGGTKSGKALELVLYMERRARLPELADIINARLQSKA